jgi:hypothetical protein
MGPICDLLVDIVVEPVFTASVYPLIIETLVIQGNDSSFVPIECKTEALVFYNSVFAY